MGRFIIKQIKSSKPQKKAVTPKENKINEVKTKVMTTSEKIQMAQNVLSGSEPLPIKRVKKDRGLIERTESSKTVLTEDNKELLKD